MSERPLKIDEDGYFVSQDIRIADDLYGKTLLENLIKTTNGAYESEYQGQNAIVEAFSEPLVARHVSHANSRWLLELNYGAQTEFSLESLFIDEWDRIHGYDRQGRAFVLSRAAQMDLFNLADSVTDEGITLAGQYRQLPLWWGEVKEMSVAPEDWDICYRTDQIPWDIGGEHPLLAATVSKLRLPKQRIAVLGSGRGHDAAYFAKTGHLVTAFDFSDEAIARARELYRHVKNLEFVKADVLELSDTYDEDFDMVFEHTCFCAIDPKDRDRLTQSWLKLLQPRGHLLGFFFCVDHRDGPPFGGSEWEIRQRLQKKYDFLYWLRTMGGREKRSGRELLVYAQKKPESV